MSATREGGLLEVSFNVQERYKGISSDKISIRTESSEAACGFPFQVGQQYLVYATQYEGVFYTTICQRTRPLAAAGRDLDYLRSMSKHPDTSDVFGSYKRYTFDPKFVPKFTPSLMDHYRPPEEYYEALAPMSGETVTVTSSDGTKLSTKVDDEGKFAFSDLPPGKYAISATAPPKFAHARGFVSGGGLNSFELLPKGCAEVTFRTQPDNWISGKVVDLKGKEIGRYVEVGVWNTSKKFNIFSPTSYAHTNEDGTFVIGLLPPGDYFVGAFVWTLPQGYPNMADERDKLTKATLRFFPSAKTVSGARPINLGIGTHVTSVEIRVPFNPADWVWVKAQ